MQTAVSLCVVATVTRNAGSVAKHNAIFGSEFPALRGYKPQITIYGIL